MNVKTSGTYNSRTNEMDVYIFEVQLKMKELLRGSLHCFVISGTLTSNTHPGILFLVTEPIGDIEMQASSPMTTNTGASLKNFAFKSQINSLSSLGFVSHLPFPVSCSYFK